MRFSIQAFADAKPLVDNDSVENRAKNRRVEIIISQDKADLEITPDKIDSADTAQQDSTQAEKPDNTTNKDTVIEVPVPETKITDDAPGFIQF